MTMAEESQKLIERIKASARKFVENNIKNPVQSDYIIVESAMMIGATIQAEVMVENKQALFLALEVMFLPTLKDGVPSTKP